MCVILSPFRNDTILKVLLAKSVINVVNCSESPP